jgi:hypothetical protein
LGTTPHINLLQRYFCCHYCYCQNAKCKASDGYCFLQYNYKPLPCAKPCFFWLMTDRFFIVPGGHR